MKCQICWKSGTPRTLKPYGIQIVHEDGITKESDMLFICRSCQIAIHRADRRREQEKLGIEKFLKGRQK